MSIIKITNAEKYYNRGKSNELHVINGVNLELPEHGMVAIFGKSGCGKTTLLNAIGGLDRLNSGSISLFDQPLSKDTDSLRNEYIGYIFQNYNLNKNETVFENVADALRLCGMTDKETIRERVNAALSNVGMEKFRDRLPDTLSGGQQQRVAIARALVKNPAVILADEPTGNLDENNTVMVMDILKELSRQSLVLLVTHEANLVDHYCDRVIEIVDGKIAGVRENADANGYVQRNKNDIYLGELPLAQEKLPGVQISYYGEPTAEVKLRIVNIAGRLYLKSDSPELKILDDTSEVRLREGVYAEQTKKQKSEASQLLDFSKLPRFEGTKFGSLFHFKNSLVLAWRSIFSGQQKKKGKRLLRVSMVLLSVVMVFLSAVFGVQVKNYFEIKENHNPNLFYLPLTVDGDYSALSDHIGENGIDYARIVGDSLDTSETIAFRASPFMTATVPNLYARGNVLDAKLSQSLTLLAGSREFSEPCDVIITSAMADDMIEDASASYLSDYEHLIGMVSPNKYMGFGNVRIIGVVKSSEKNFYFNSIYAAYLILNNTVYLQAVAPRSLQSVYEGEVAPNTVVLFKSFMMQTGKNYKVGDKIKIFGKTFQIAKLFDDYDFYTDYAKYVKDVSGSTLLNEADWIEANRVAGKDDTALRAEYWFDYYLEYYWDFADTVKNAWESKYYSPADEAVWVLSTAHEKGLFLNYCNSDDSLFASLSFYQENGRYPSESELQTYLSNQPQQIQAFKEGVSARVIELRNQWQNYCSYFGYDKVSANPAFILNDADYQALAYSAGESSEEVGAYAFATWSYSNGLQQRVQYQNYMLIHAADINEARNYLSAAFGEDLIQPEARFADELAGELSGIIYAAVSVCVVLFLLCLCIFFIMRASFMGRVKEIGVLRAVGVSKKNLIYRFSIEAILLGVTTIVVGFLLSWWFIQSLSGTVLFSEIFFFPPWLALGLLVILLLATFGFGVLPAALLLQKTPSEILSKYDI